MAGEKGKKGAMRLKNILLVVKDIERSKAFYRDLFGLETVTEFEGNVVLTEGLVLEEQSLWEQASGRSVRNGGNDAELYFEESNLDFFLEKLHLWSPPVEYISECSEDGCGQRALRIYDPDHHIIEVKETMDGVVRRYQNMGMTAEDIAAGTGLPLDIILGMMTPVHEENNIILETERLYLREMNQQDILPLSRILQDSEVMYAYEHAFSDQEVQEWLDKQRKRYKDYGFGLWAVIEKQSGQMIGQCGLTMQPWGEKEVLEIGYLFRKSFWHQGFAAEAAAACKEYAFGQLGAEEVYSIIRDDNLASQLVAVRNGMERCGELTKHYYGKDMLHYVYSAKCRKD